MFKKMFVTFAFVATLSVFAATEFKTANYSALNANTVAQIKADLVNANGFYAAGWDMAIQSFEGNKDLTIEEMEGVAKKYCSRKSEADRAVLNYLVQYQTPDIRI